MSQPMQVPFLEQFAALRDPRQAAKVLYPSPELLLLLCGTVSGADDFVELTLWGEEHLPFLRRFLPQLGRAAAKRRTGDDRHRRKDLTTQPCAVQGPWTAAHGVGLGDGATARHSQ